MDAAGSRTWTRREPRAEGGRLQIVERVTVGLIALVVWTEMDISAKPLYAERAAYNEVWYLALFGLLLVLGIAYRTVALPFGVWLLSAIGGEDALYFYLQLRPVPARLPWLDGHALVWQPPTNVSITAGLVAGFVALVGLVLLERWVIARWRQEGWKAFTRRPARSPADPDAEVDRRSDPGRT